MSILSEYLNEIRTIRNTGAGVAETSYYPALANLFTAVGSKLKPKVICVIHLQNTGGGIPEAGFFTANQIQRSTGALLPGQKPAHGVLEVKPLTANMDQLAGSEQVLRYLTHYNQVLITNLREFRLLVLEEGVARRVDGYTLAGSTDALFHPSTLTAHADLFPEFLERVLRRSSSITDPGDLAWFLASYAREARARAATHPLVAFDGVKSALQESLGITFEGDKGEHFFLSTLIQTLFYGIFSAWVLFKRSQEGRPLNAVFNWRLSSDYLRIPVLRTLFHAVSERGALNTVQIIEILDLAADTLNRVQPGFFATFREEDAVNYFYEPFLEAFDPELRKQLGVWYTPREIVRYMVERVDHLLRSELHEPLGLASPNVQVLDPCCGTGAYLVEVLYKIQRTLTERAGDDTQYVGSDLRHAATTRIFGFEIMPAPFVIAHLQIARLLEDAGSSLTEDQRAMVYLTNALTGWVPARHPQSNFGFPAFMDERDAAEAVKQAATILVILGNPPYNGYAGIAKIEEERDLTTAYRTPVPGLPAPQGQGLNDLYVRFFRIAERRIVGDKEAKGNKNGRGLVSFISNNNWLDGLSHVSMRAKFLQEFQSIYIDNLNGDKYRTGKATPDGKPDPSAFSTPQNREGIQVGTAIATLVRTAELSSPLLAIPSPLLVIPEGNLRSEPPTTNAVISTGAQRSGETPVLRAAHAAKPAIHLRDLWGTQKLTQLSEEAKQPTSPRYNPVAPTSALGLPFADRIHSDAYTTWPRLPELFPVSFPGIKTSRDPFVVDIDMLALLSKLKKYFDPKISDAQITSEIPSALDDTASFEASKTRAFLQREHQSDIEVAKENHKNLGIEELEHAVLTRKVRKFLYRPFDQRFLYWEPLTNLIDRKREDYVAAVIGSYSLLSSQANRKCFDPPAITKQLASLHVIERGTTAFPFAYMRHVGNTFDAFQLGLQVGGAEIVENTNEKFRERLDTIDSNDDLFLHALATMHTPQYRTENSGALLGDWPRIPLPATAELLTHSATLGRRLAELLDPESSIELVAEWSFLGRLILPAELPEGIPDRDQRNAARLALTAGWGGAGQGATVMPRRGDARERDYTPTELERLTALAAAQSLTLDAALTLLGVRCVDVYLNGDALWSAIPINVWGYTLGGYQVLKKWLSYRELPLLGRPLLMEEARYFAQVARRIAAILLMGPALDASYAALLPTANLTE